jgi:hypothetical protein
MKALTIMMIVIVLSIIFGMVVLSEMGKKVEQVKNAQTKEYEAMAELRSLIKKLIEKNISV